MTLIYRFSVLAMLLLASFSGLQAQKKDKKKVVTTEFKVAGVCGMCKTRIENAALIKGVKFAEWDQTTTLLKVIYKPAKVDEMTIHQSLADAGHDTDKAKATDEVYEKIPACCDYRGGVKPH